MTGKTVLAVAVAAMVAASTASATICIVPDNGSGTADMPPQCSEGYLSPDDVHVIIDGLPPGTTIEIDASHTKFFVLDEGPGGNLGGEFEIFMSILILNMTGTGDLAGFNRVITIQVNAEAHIGPRTLGDPVQDFPTDMFRLQGELFGDPDFCLLTITGGTDFGLPSPGNTTLTLQGDGNWAVDSFFDITYQIDFQGCPGSVLEGMAGTTTATIRMQAGEPVGGPGDPCEVVDDGTGTVSLPPVGCDYLSPDEVHEIIDGLPAGTTIELAPIHTEFICRQGGQEHCGNPGGDLGGEVEIFDSILQMDVNGTGDLGGFQRTLMIPVFCETHTGPRNPGDPVQDFDTDMFRLQGELFGDPDFCILRVTAGTDFGLPSPGHTTVTRLGPPGSNWSVDSFFDMSYRIEFEGCPGSVLDGLSGITQATIRMQVGNPGGLPTVLPGSDFWETIDPTNVEFGTPYSPPIPADFFGPGSDPFTGVVDLMGDPLDPPNMGTADTIVERLDPASLPNIGDAQTVAIELVALSLVSIEPIIVTENGGQNPQPWDVEVSIAPTVPSMGQMEITRTHDNGGTFTSQIMVYPVFTFTNQSGQEYPLAGPPMNLQALTPHGWQHDPLGPPFIQPPGAGPNFFPTEEPNEEVHPGGAIHTVIPARELSVIPAVSDWGMAFMLVVVVGAAVVMIRRRHARA